MSAASALENKSSTSSEHQAFAGKDVLSVKQFSAADVQTICALADRMKHIVTTSGGVDWAKHRVLTALFYEPSTRTSSSFQSAMLRLGGGVVPITDVSNSSVAKGETLEDTIRTLENYSDVIVIRHPANGSAAAAANAASIPILNAGDGTGEHPTQALLDFYTIKQELGHVDGITVTMLGDLKHGRTVHSLAKLLALFKVKLNYVSPDFLRMPTEVQEDLQRLGVEQHETTDLRSVLPQTDVLYVTRVQKERFKDMNEYTLATQSYQINSALLKEAGAKEPGKMIIMHPLPRVNEIATEIDSDPRAAYFRQMRYGLYVRMALLALVLGVVKSETA